MKKIDRIAAMQTAIAMHQVTPSQRVILAHLAAIADDSGCATVSVSQIARTINFCLRNVQRSMPYLYDKGFIELMPGSRPWQARGIGNQPYIFRLGPWAYERVKAAA